MLILEWLHAIVLSMQCAVARSNLEALSETETLAQILVSTPFPFVLIYT